MKLLTLSFTIIRGIFKLLVFERIAEITVGYDPDCVITALADECVKCFAISPGTNIILGIMVFTLKLGYVTNNIASVYNIPEKIKKYKMSVFNLNR